MSHLSYVDENFKYYPSRDPSQTEAQDASLVANAGPAGRSSPFQRLEYGDPNYQPAPPKKRGLAALFGENGGRYPLEQRIENRKRGIGRQPRPYAVYVLSVILFAVFIYQLARNWQEQGTPFSFKPVVNPMLGPSTSAAIQAGARYPLCMKRVEGVPIDLQLPCLNNTANPADRVCPLEVVCAFGGFHGKEPNQWFRFITPVFLHTGVIHILVNVLAMFFLSGEIEKLMGSVGFLILFLATGIFGNVLGGNFALVGIPSMGASGAIMGTLAVLWVDLFAHWQFEEKPGRKLLFLFLDLAIVVAIGYIPNAVDNFAHLGGFFMGLQMGIILLPVISTTRRHKMIMWGLRIAVIPLVIVLFVVLIRNFYTPDPAAACPGCRYLSCIPMASNNHCQGNGLTLTYVPN